MDKLKKKEEKKIIKKLHRNLSLIYSKCEIILKKHTEGGSVNEKDYIWFVFSADIYYRIKDIAFLNQKLKETKNNFDSSLYVLSRSVLESFIYFMYLLCEESKIKYRLCAFVCHSTRNNEISILNALRMLERKGKFIFDSNPASILSSETLNKKIVEFNDSITKYKNFYKEEPAFTDEIEVFKKIESVAQKYDEIKCINSVTDGSENKSMEWMYNYVYRFQCMSAHQSLRDKEKVFNLFNKKKEIDNVHILGLLSDITEQILTL